MPVFNEAATVETVVRKVLDLPISLELIIVDDGSDDGTREIVDGLGRTDPRIRVIHQENAGKSAALRAGFAQTTGAIVIVQDADFEYDPSEIAHVIQPIVDDHADVVYGSRFMVRRTARVLYYWHYVANQFLTLISNILTNLNMTDIETGYKAFRGEIIRAMVIEASGFGFEVEVTAKVAKLGVIIYEVPISYYGRTYEQGKKIGMRDGLAAIWYLVRFNLLVGISRSFLDRPEVGKRADPMAEPSCAAGAGLPGNRPTKTSARS
jgi:glycosyltransferase involved in cell wall biosynthesis